MKKIIFFLFLFSFVAAPAFAQTHRLKKRQKRGRSTQTHQKRKKSSRIKKTRSTKVQNRRTKTSRVQRPSRRTQVRTHKKAKRQVVIRSRHGHTKIKKTTYLKRGHRSRVKRVHHVYPKPRVYRVFKPSVHIHHIHHDHCGHSYLSHEEIWVDDFEDNIFEIPELACPYRTTEVLSGNEQWCETRRGVRHGPYKRWSDYGDLVATGQYSYDDKQGPWTEYHENGSVHREIEYDNGHRCGTWASWDSKGIAISVVLY